MFEVGGEYANRRGTYRVLSIDGPRMRVRYEDGTEAELNVNIQERIWENILAEREAAEQSRSARLARRLAGSDANHYIKVVSIPPGEELTFPGWEERVVMATKAENALRIKKGDRLIYYATEARTFFAVATVTGEGFTASPKKYTFTQDIEEAMFFPIDVDAETSSLESGVTLDSVELESCPEFGKRPAVPETFCPINEDDFELLAEALTELSEEEETEFEEDEFEEEEDE